jgi:hypothetical protein
MGLARNAVPILVAAVVVGTADSGQAKSNVSWNWGTNGSGACIAVDGVNKYFTPTNCQITLGPWWSAKAVGLTTKWIPCNSTYYNNLEAWNYEKLSGATPIHGIYGIAYQTNSGAFTWDDFDIWRPIQLQSNTPASPGSGGVGLQNWSLDTKSFQGAVACLNADSPTKPSSDAAAGAPKRLYDFAAWETVLDETRDRRRVVKQVVLEEGKTQSFRLNCPAGTIRSGGVDYGVGHATQQQPDPKKASKTDVRFSASPLRGGAEIRVKPNKLTYPTVVQLSMVCRRK